jgi:hypothetical protein
MLAFTLLFPGAVSAQEEDRTDRALDQMMNSIGRPTQGNPHVEAIHTAVLEMIESGGTRYDKVGDHTQCDLFLCDLVKRTGVDPNFTQDHTAVAAIEYMSTNWTQIKPNFVLASDDARLQEQVNEAYNKAKNGAFVVATVLGGETSTGHVAIIDGGASMTRGYGDTFDVPYVAQAGRLIKGKYAQSKLGFNYAFTPEDAGRVVFYYRDF